MYVKYRKLKYIKKNASGIVEMQYIKLIIYKELLPLIKDSTITLKIIQIKNIGTDKPKSSSLSMIVIYVPNCVSVTYVNYLIVNIAILYLYY